jgi:hypothetical protein
VILRTEADRAAVGAASSEIENTPRLPPRRMMDTDTDLTFV